MQARGRASDHRQAERPKGAGASKSIPAHRRPGCPVADLMFDVSAFYLSSLPLRLTAKHSSQSRESYPPATSLISVAPLESSAGSSFQKVAGLSISAARRFSFGRASRRKAQLRRKNYEVSFERFRIVTKMAMSSSHSCPRADTFPGVTILPSRSSSSQ